jgi:hypothetical protein
VASETPAFATVISLPIHPNAYTNDALIVGTLQAEGRCLFLVGARGTRSGVAWPAGTKWDPNAGALVLGDVKVSVGQEVAIGGGSADVTLDNLWRTAWLVRPLPECLGDGFILAGSVSLAIPSTNP